MRKNLLLYSLSLLLTVGACKKYVPESEKERPKTIDSNGQVLLSKTEINNYIAKTVYTKKSFRWGYVSEQVVWSALSQSDDKILSVGYKPESWSNIDVADRVGTFSIESNEWRDAKKEVLKLIFEEERKKRPHLKIEELEVWPEKYLPVICVSAHSLASISKLRQSKYVRYVEPIGYDSDILETNKNRSLDESKALGCDGAPPYSGMFTQGTDYIDFSPLTIASWNYSFHNITQAWSVSSGKDIKVMVVDTGCSLDQENLNSQFNQGQSVGRTIEHLVTLPRPTFLGIPRGDPETPDDACGHGTRMAGIFAAPRGTDGNICGIAYNCDLVTVRAAENVILNQSREAKGVADAFNVAANRNDIKIISMSMGYPFYISQIADAVKNASNRGKLIFCAAGTSTRVTSWLGVGFPASMPEVNAVTGIQDNLKNKCSNCHEGPEVDFVVVMQKTFGNKLDVLTLAVRGDMPAIVGGSSAATASMAGMAALVWSRYPNKSTNEILNILKKNAANPGNPNWGAGLVDVAQAVGAPGWVRYETR